MAPYVTSRTAEGKLGMKTGSGVFNYTPDEVGALRKERARKLVAVRKALES
jgi:3-hydroxybutyryl-CoA dehydrogenase/5-formyl-3-hydroxy-2-methylpyridine 4-carboxylate dehydrogenase